MDDDGNVNDDYGDVSDDYGDVSDDDGDVVGGLVIRKSGIETNFKLN